MIAWWFAHPVYAAVLTITFAASAVAGALLWPNRRTR